MIDWDTIRDKGNAWKLLYAAYVAVEYAPDENFDDYYDDEGTFHEGCTFSAIDLRMTIEELGEENIEFGHIWHLSIFLRRFLRDGKEGKITSPTYDEYLKRWDIIKSVKGFGLNEEQFWYAILFINWLTEKWGTGVIKYRETASEQIQTAINYLRDVQRFTIVVKEKDEDGGKEVTKKIQITDQRTISAIREVLNKQYAIREQTGHVGILSLNSRSKGEDQESNSVKMWFAAKRYLALLENLEVKKREVGDSLLTSYNKELFASRLIFYFADLTDNENFKKSDESLRGIIKQYNNHDFKSIRLNLMF